MSPMSLMSPPPPTRDCQQVNSCDSLVWVVPAAEVNFKMVTVMSNLGDTDKHVDHRVKKKTTAWGG